MREVISDAKSVQGANSGGSMRTSKQGDSHGKFVVEEQLEVGL
jgi:hypothetical protein